MTLFRFLIRDHDCEVQIPTLLDLFLASDLRSFLVHGLHSWENSLLYINEFPTLFVLLLCILMILSVP